MTVRPALYDAPEPAKLILTTTEPRRALWARAAAQRGVSLHALAEQLLDESVDDLRIGDVRQADETKPISPWS